MAPPSDSDIEALLRAHAESSRDSKEHGRANVIAEAISERFKDMAVRVAQLERELSTVRDSLDEHKEVTGRHEIARLTEHAKALEAERKSWFWLIIKTIVSVVMLGLGILAQKLFGGKHP